MRPRKKFKEPITDYTDSQTILRKSHVDNRSITNKQSSIERSPGSVNSKKMENKWQPTHDTRKSHDSN